MKLNGNPIRASEEKPGGSETQTPTHSGVVCFTEEAKASAQPAFQMVKYELSVAIIHQSAQCGPHLICVGTGWMRCLDSKALILCTQLAWEIAPSDIIMSHEVLRFYCFK